jgi:hypothetical protein
MASYVRHARQADAYSAAPEEGNGLTPDAASAASEMKAWADGYDDLAKQAARLQRWAETEDEDSMGRSGVFGLESIRDVADLSQVPWARDAIAHQRRADALYSLLGAVKSFRVGKSQGVAGVRAILSGIALVQRLWEDEETHSGEYERGSSDRVRWLRRLLGKTDVVPGVGSERDHYDDIKGERHPVRERPEAPEGKAHMTPQTANWIMGHYPMNQWPEDVMALYRKTHGTHDALPRKIGERWENPDPERPQGRTIGYEVTFRDGDGGLIWASGPLPKADADAIYADPEVWVFSPEAPEDPAIRRIRNDLSVLWTVSEAIVYWTGKDMGGRWIAPADGDWGKMTETQRKSAAVASQLLRSKGVHSSYKYAYARMSGKDSAGEGPKDRFFGTDEDDGKEGSR